MMQYGYEQSEQSRQKSNHTSNNAMLSRHNEPDVSIFKAVTKASNEPNRESNIRSKITKLDDSYPVPDKFSIAVFLLPAIRNSMIKQVTIESMSIREFT
jgi:hypothetical protein